MANPDLLHPGPDTGKGLFGQLVTQLQAEAAAEVGRLAASAATSLACGTGLERAELAIRAAVLELGRAVLEPLLAAGPGYRGPRAGCAAGHQAEFESYRDKTIDTVLGPVTLRRAWYHCSACRHGFAPRDRELGVAGDTMSPGLAKMTDRAAAALPFTTTARLVGELAGITLTSERARSRAEADGQAAAQAIEAEAAAITARQVISLPQGRSPIWPPRSHASLAASSSGKGGNRVECTAAETGPASGRDDLFHRAGIGSSASNPRSAAACAHWSRTVCASISQLIEFRRPHRGEISPTFRLPCPCDHPCRGCSDGGNQRPESG